jgi:hypothetical protein
MESFDIPKADERFEPHVQELVDGAEGEKGEQEFREDV